MNAQLQLFLVSRIWVSRIRVVVAVILFLCTALVPAAAGSTNRPLPQACALLPKPRTPNTSNNSFRDAAKNGGMLALTNAVVNTRRPAGSGVTLEAAAREMHSTVHRVIRRGTNNATGEPTSQVSHIVELADGLNYPDQTGNWHATRAVFEETTEAFVARFGPHKAILAREMGEEALDLEMPDGVRLVGAPLCLGYFDPVNGKSVILAIAQPSTAQQISSNQVLFPDVFSSPRASVRYTYEQNRFHQDVLLHEAPAAPGNFNLSDRSRLEVMTEWRPDIAEPQKTQRILNVETNEALRSTMAEPEFVDESLAFGLEMTMGAGRAFTLPGGSESQPDAVPIGKRFLRIDNRPILVEAIEHRAIKPWLDSLPKASAAARGKSGEAEYAVADRRSLPRAPWNRGEQAKTNSRQQRETVVASVEPSVVLDFVFELNGTKSNWLFANNTNYWVTGNVNLNGTTTIEGGVCIKFKKGVGAKLNVNGAVVCNTSQYFPAVLTADEDDSVGEFVYPSSPEVTPTGYYATTALNFVNNTAATLKHLRISYAQNALVFNSGQATANYSLSHLQVIDCQNALTVYGHSSQYYGTYYANFYVGNALFTDVVKSFTGNYYTGTVEHMTVDGCTSLAEASPASPYSTLVLRNSIIANTVSLGSGVYGFGNGSSYNGFYSSPQFGSSKFVSTNSPFQTVALGGHYLLSDSTFRQKGTTGINSTTLNDLKKRTTQAPVILAYPTLLNVDMVWFPQMPRYVSGAPDLGFAYDPLDYVVADLVIFQTRLQVSPGTAIGVWPTLRSDIYGEPYFCALGLFVAGAAEFISEGSPTKLNRIVTTDLVQEGYNPYAGFIGGMWGVNMLTCDRAADGGPYPTISCRFTDFAMLSDFRRYHSAIGPDEEGIWWTYGDFAAIDFRDCQFRGGNLNLAQWESETTGPIRLNNTLFERVRTTIWLALDGPLDTYNNLFKGGELNLYAPTDPNSWIFKDNLFDRCSVMNGAPVVNDFNGYWLDIGQPRLTPNGANDRVLTSAPVYQVGTLGRYYYPTTSLLHNGGSRTAADASLYHYTTRLDQKKDGEETTETPYRVNIGLHYTALVSSQPKDTDADGLPDYFEDKNGNNGLDTDETNLTLADTDNNGTLDRDEALYEQVDLDSDGVVNAGERFLNTNPQIADNPLAITGLPNANLEGNFEIPIALPGPIIDLADSVLLAATDLASDDSYDELQPAAGMELVETQPGNYVAEWNTSYHRNTFRAICLEIAYHEDYPPIRGPLRNVTTDNYVRFPDAYDGFGWGLGVLAVTFPESSYVIELFDENGMPLTYNDQGTWRQFTLEGMADEFGVIDRDWDLAFPNGASFSGQTVRGEIYVTPPPGIPDRCPRVPGAESCARRIWKQEASWSDGKYVLARVGECPPEDPHNKAMVAKGIIDIIGDDFQNGYYQLAPQNDGGPHGENKFIRDWNGMVWPQTADNVFKLVAANKPELMTTFADPSSRNFFWHGHSGGDGFGYSAQRGPSGQTLYDRCPELLAAFTRVTSKEVREALQNNGRRVFNHPYRLVFIHGCCAATGDLCTAFGIPRERVDVGRYVNKRKVPARAFIGAKKITSEWWGDEASAKRYHHSFAVFFRHWMINDTVSDALQRAKDPYDSGDPWDSGEQYPIGKVRDPLDKSFVVYGATDLRRSGGTP